MAVEPRVGEKAPGFVLEEAYGGMVSLAGLLPHGLTVVVFFSGSFGYMCNLQMKQLMHMYEDFKRADAEIVGIGTNSRFVNSAWKEHLQLPFPILSDFDGQVSSSFGVLIGEKGYILNGHARRSVFIIDRDGVVRYVWVSYDPSQAEEPDYDGLLETCQKLHSQQDSSS